MAQGGGVPAVVPHAAVALGIQIRRPRQQVDPSDRRVLDEMGGQLPVEERGQVSRLIHGQVQKPDPLLC